MKVSVVISTHNRTEALRRLIGQLLAQEYRGATEILVVDSSAGSGSEAIVREAYDHRVRHVMSSNNLAAKRNAGARSASGELLIFLDDDMSVESPNFIANHVAAHMSHGSDALVSGSILFPPTWVDSSNLYRFKAANHAAAPQGDRVRPNAVVAMNNSVSKRLFERVGGFDESFAGYGGEDIEYGFRFRRAGASLVLASEAWAIHAERKLTATSYAKKMYDAGYSGIPTLLRRVPEARDVRTIAVVAGGSRGVGPKAFRLLCGSVSRPWVVRACSKTLDYLDSCPRLYSPTAYRVLALLATRLGYSDAQAGVPPRWGLGWGGR